MASQAAMGNAPALIDILRRLGYRVLILERRVKRREVGQNASNEVEDETILHEFFRFEELLQCCVKWVSDRTGEPEPLLIEVARVSEPLGRPDLLAVFPKLHALDREGATAELWQTLVSADRDALVSVGLLGESAPEEMAEDKPHSDEGQSRGLAVRRLLSLYTDGLADERIERAATVLQDEVMNTNDKLTKIDEIMPLPSAASAEQLGKTVGVTKQAVMKTDWWQENRRGEKNSEIGRRYEKHRERSDLHDPNEL